MLIINSEEISPLVFELLSFATSKSKVRNEYSLYLEKPDRTLYGYESNGVIIGCIGIEVIQSHKCEIKHIAVNVEHRRIGIGRKMIQYINDKYKTIIAETDKDAIDFYKSYGFTVISLGQTYPGVERFNCMITR